MVSATAAAVEAGAAAGPNAATGFVPAREGIVALTLHTVSHSLTVPVERETGVQTADMLHEALRDRRRQLKAEARQLRRAAEENAALRAGTVPPPLPNSSA